MLKKILLILFVICLSAGAAYAQNRLKINEELVEEGAILNIFKDELIANKILILIETEEDIESVEVSLDKGRSWDQASKTKDGFLYEYRPLRNETLFVIFFLKDKKGSMKTYNPYVKLIYQDARPEAAIFVVLDKMKTFYEQENKWQFMSLFSQRFPDRIKFEEAIQNDFVAYNNIRLRYRVERKTFAEDLSAGIWDVFWERKYTTRTGSNVSDSSNIKMQLVKEGLRWLISGLDGNNIFGSTLVAEKADLAITANDIDCSPATIVGVSVHNRGSTDALDVDVDFDEVVSGTGCILTIPRIAAYSNVHVAAGCLAQCTPGTTFRIKVDPDKLIDELSETNNAATRSF